VFTKHELAKLFSNDHPKTFSKSLNRLVKAGILVHACRRIYVNKEGADKDPFIIERIAKALRFGEYNYVSLESMRKLLHNLLINNNFFTVTFYSQYPIINLVDTSIIAGGALAIGS